MIKVVTDEDVVEVVGQVVEMTVDVVKDDEVVLAVLWDVDVEVGVAEDDEEDIEAVCVELVAGAGPESR